jgi:hypothetical protein
MYYIENIGQLNTLMTAVFASKQLSDAGYTNLPDEDKMSFVGQAEDFIDDFNSIRYRGDSVEDYQVHAFPRKLGGRIIEKTDTRVQKALAYIIFDKVKFEENSRKKQIEQGVKSMNLDGQSESYVGLNELVEVSDNYERYLGFCMIQGCL